MTSSCHCCGSKLSASLETPRLRLSHCRVCGTYWADHLLVREGTDIWQSESITPTFLNALAARRRHQSKSMADHFASLFQKGLVLDYGCGQGIFTEELRSRRWAAMGCDVSDAVAWKVDPDWFIRLPEPWSFPALARPVTSVALLDVLEHCTSPVEFIRLIKERGISSVIVKVPMTNGPLFQIALLAARLGHPLVLEKLFLVKDPVPHVVYFSAEGLQKLFESGGFALAGTLRMAELGSELPDRIRGAEETRWHLSRPILAFAGILLNALSIFTSDTAVFQFNRKP